MNNLVIGGLVCLLLAITRAHMLATPDLEGLLLLLSAAGALWLTAYVRHLWQAYRQGGRLPYAHRCPAPLVPLVLALHYLAVLLTPWLLLYALLTTLPLPGALPW